MSAGHIILDGRDITDIRENEIAEFRRDNLGFVFQEYNLLDTLTLEENVALPLTIKGLNSEEIDKRVRDTADKLHISGKISVSGFRRAETALCLCTGRDLPSENDYGR